MNKSHPLTGFLELQRKTARGYTCPICEKIYHQEPKIWAHGNRNHPEYLGDTVSTEKAESVRKRFKQEALDKTQQKATATGKATSAAADRTAHPLSDPNKSSGTNFGGEDLRPTSSTPVSARGNSQGPEKRIDDIRNLSLEQVKSKERKERPVSVNNPRKRGAEGGSGSPDPPAGGYKVESMSTRLRHGNTLSGSRDAEPGRRGTLPDEPDYKRGFTGYKQLLWDPETDSPNTTKVVRREKQRGHNKPNDWRHPSGDFHSPEKGSVLSEKDNAYPHAHVGHEKPQLQQAPGSHDGPGSSFPFEKDRDDLSSGSPLADDVPEDEHPEASEGDPEMLLQPETRPISHEQLVVEVKGIYAGLVMVEAKCIDIDERQSAAAQERDPSKRPELKNDQWQSLIALHKQLLHEHHDFFLASQHPSASVALSKLAAKYSMPARMWRHGIHAFLEVLRHRLPESLEHMLAFIYIAYSMMALLYETVPAFEDTWIECLGDLGRYRMAIEDDEPRDREVWSNVAKFWYNKASDKTPVVGRLYHHLAILARPYTLEQLSLYTRSLTCVIPFESAKGSIMTLFTPVLQSKDTVQRRPSSLETLVIRAHAILFTSKPLGSPDQFDATVDEIERDGLFERYIIKSATRFKETGAFIAISNIAAIFEYGFARDGKSKSRLRKAFEYAQTIKEEAAKSVLGKPNDPMDLPPPSGPPDADADNSTKLESDDSSVLTPQSSRLAFISLDICLKRPRDSNVYPLVHVYFGFIWSLIIVQQACKYFEQDTVLKTIEKDIPWIGVCLFLNTLAADPQAMTSKTRRQDFPRPFNETGRPLPEDFVMRGQLFTQWYFPANWFSAAMIDDDERSHDLPSMAQPRKERILWLGHCIASTNRYIRFENDKERFSPTEFTNKNLAIHTTVEPATGDQDTVMSETGSTAEDTPRTMCLAPSESLGASRDSTRASTPTEHDMDLPARPTTPKAGDQSAATDDVPMMDVSPIKEGRNSSP